MTPICAGIGLVKAKSVCVRHGVSTFDLSRYLNRWGYNFKLITTATKREYDDIVNDANFGYDDNRVKLTGMPRLDGLYDDRGAEGVKKIVFMPTWRMELFPQGEASKHNPDFKRSAYALTISSLLTDCRLLDLLDRHGYALYFAPHPVVARQAGEIAVDPRVTVETEFSYQKLFAEAYLLITDYSSTAFDFAYLRKPVVYYQFAPSADKPNPIDYKRDGFGEVVNDVKALTDILENYMRTGYVMEERYIKRVGECFAYNDRNNCRRVHNAVLEV